MRGVTSADLDDRPGLLDRIEGYYDAVPRSGARAEDFGPLTLFVREGQGWPFYARPTRGPGHGAPSAADVDRVRARQRELGIPESFEWVAETAPALRAAVEESGLVVHEHPLMVLAPDAQLPDAAGPSGPPGPPGGISVRILGPEDPALAHALAVPHLAFAEPGTGIGTAGAEDLARAVRAGADDGSVDRMAARIRAGLTAVAVAEENATALCAGQHQPVGPVSEIVGVGTLPSARRRGLGRVVTAALLADARARGISTVFLSAGDEDVARLYAGLGFRRVATALIAEPAA
ncbi:GNAT family N-acetyltransferase [Streptomyces sp. NPDC057445]|uniref:GNAT family N-acetyltransferase n=1 Tax=Streptomyces sp. NPDC057445 TaxID=3346136 RepID=UPI003676CA00